MNVTDSERALLLKLLALGRAVEQDARAADGLPGEALARILALASAFDASTELGLRKIAALTDGLYPGMPLEKFAHFMVPVERLLDRSAKDFDFLITTQDSAPTPAKAQAPEGPGAEILRAPLVAVLDHLRSGFNVGSIFRVADGFGLTHLHLVGYTAKPEEAGVAKTALGADATVPWTSWKSMDECLAHLRAEGYATVALETSTSAVSIYEFRFPEKTALLLGNERFGLNYAVVAGCDHALAIPLRGTKNSLNVVSAFAIASYEWSRQWNARGSS